jgi:6-phosphogluconolactonase (cycloisomerase 2 family)
MQRVLRTTDRATMRSQFGPKPMLPAALALADAPNSSTPKLEAASGKRGISPTSTLASSVTHRSPTCSRISPKRTDTTRPPRHTPLAGASAPIAAPKKKPAFGAQFPSSHRNRRRDSPHWDLLEYANGARQRPDTHNGADCGDGTPVALHTHVLLRYFAPWASVLALLSLQPGCLSIAENSAGSSPSDSEVAGGQGAMDGPLHAGSSAAPSACATSADVWRGAAVNALALERVGQAHADVGPKFVYAANQNSHDVSTYAVNASGSLTAVGAPIGVGKYPEAIALLPSGTGLFVANHGSNSVSGFKVDAMTGVLTSIGPMIATAAAGPTAILAHPGGHFVYVGSDDATSRTPNVVTAYQVDSATDGLTAVGASNTDGAGLVAMSIDPSGRFLYTANALSDDVSVFSIDSCSGALSKVGTNVASAFPVSLSIDPAGKFLYVAAGGSDPSIQTFGLDATSGAAEKIDELKGVSLPWGLKALELDGTGKFLFVVTVGQGGASSVSTFAVDPRTGIPSAVPGSSVAAGAGAAPVAVDQSGGFAYVGNFESNDISAYSLDRSTGTFTAIGTFPAGTAPGALAIFAGQTF